MIRRAGRVALVVAMAMAACSGDDGEVRTGAPEGEAPAEAPNGEAPPDAAWVHHGHVERRLPGNIAALAIEDADAWSNAWADHGYSGERPDVDFATHVVLLVGQPDDNCPDELIGVDVVDGNLEVEWLPPAGGCEQPLILRLHAVEVHRGHLPTEFTFVIGEPYAEDFEPVTIVLPPFDGDAPPPPAPPQAMSDAELDAVFDGHPVQRCDDDTYWWRAPRPVDGPLSDDPAVADAQQQRADFGVASDEATVRALLDDPPPTGVEGMGFPLTAEEWDLEASVSETMDRVTIWLSTSAWNDREHYTPLIDRGDGIRPAIIVGEEDAAEIKADLDAEFGPGTVTVHITEWDPAAVTAAQDAVSSILDQIPEPSRITSISGPPGPAAIGLVDPTREALDVIADAVDPSLVCVEVERSGVLPTDGG